MENHDTFNFANVVDVDNWIIVGLAMWKMFTFFWPVVVVTAAFMFISHKKEIANDNR